VRALVDGAAAFRRIAEAVQAARRSVWLTVTFYAPDFRFPDGQGGLFDLLDAAVQRGVDVRVLFWRPNAESAGYGRYFAGSAEDRAMLAARRSRVKIRWDRSPGRFCQHQKSWIVDAETAFVGGINLTAKAVGTPGHADGSRHDVYVEVAGPAVADMRHNFVQRWNEASERHTADGVWGHDAAERLAFPEQACAACGGSVVQIQRMVPADRYSDDRPAPGGAPWPVAAGERSILEQYLRAIDAARHCIYIENQAIPIPAVARPLAAALRRGVAVVALVPAEPEDHVRAARGDPARRELFACVEALGRHDGFTLAGIAAPDGRAIYVHAKLMLVDDAWATIGSCNLHANSLGGHTEMNAAVWDADFVRALRCELLREHLGEDTAHLDGAAALRRFREIARAGRAAAPAGGLAFALDPRDYGR
jgi:phosphatidylserine/phosphatidylglycerophosphate/cardiolipin synthase-like enzyme